MSEAAPLSEAEQRTWGAFAALLDLMSSALDAALHEHGLNLYSFAVLAALADAPGQTLRMSELAARVNSSPSRLSHMVRRLQDKGWVERSPASEDARGHLARLTGAGRRAVRDASPSHAAAVRSLVLVQLDQEQQEALHRLSCRLLEQFDVTLPGCG